MTERRGGLCFRREGVEAANGSDEVGGDGFSGVSGKKAVDSPREMLGGGR